jgi:3-phosphoshikimate 1-carboxyvinyltransferase
VKPLPDPYPIEPLTKPPNCTITVPGSKSITNRALILGALDKEKIQLRSALWADDTQVMVDSLNRLGIKTVATQPDENSNCDIEVEGQAGRIPVPKADLYVGNAGTAARFLTALVCLGRGEYTIRGDKRMHERPMKDLFDTLTQLGAKFDFIESQDRLPVKVRANGLTSKGLADRNLNLDPSKSTQFASALYMIGPYIQDGFHLELPTEYKVDPCGYIGMTQKVIHDFPQAIHKEKEGVWLYEIEPDFSSASYFMASEFVTCGDMRRRVKIDKWKEPPDSWVLQPDSHFPAYLPPPARVSRAEDLGDSVMTLAICALFGKQPMQLVNASRLRLQETDRIKAMVTELQRVGAKAEEHEDGFTVWPAKPDQLHGADIETYDDHRMAMCFSVLGLKVPGIRIKNPQCVSKTFPNFFEKLEQLRQ